MESHRPPPPSWVPGALEATALAMLCGVYLAALAWRPFPPEAIPMQFQEIRHLMAVQYLDPGRVESWLGTPYPPLTYVLAAMAVGAEGSPEGPTYAAYLAFAPLLLAGTWLLARRAAGRAAALLATLLVMSSSYVVAASQTFQIEFALAAMTTAFWAMLAAGSLSRPLPALGCGLFLGLGLLTKHTFLFYTAAGVLWACRHQGWPSARQVALGGMAAGAAMLPWLLLREGWPLLVAGEVPLLLYGAWLWRHRAGPWKGLVFATAALAVAGPWYVAGIESMEVRHQGWEMWLAGSPEPRTWSFLAREYLGVLSTLIPDGWILVGASALSLSLAGHGRGTFVLLLLQVGLALGLLGLFRLTEFRFFVPLVPLWAVLAAMFTPHLRRLAPLVPAAVMVVMVHGFSEEAWATLRTTKDPFGRPAGALVAGRHHPDSSLDHRLKDLLDPWRRSGWDLWVLVDHREDLDDLLGAQGLYLQPLLHTPRGGDFPLRDGSEPAPPVAGDSLGMVVAASPEAVRATAETLGRRWGLELFPLDQATLDGAALGLYRLR